MVSNNNSQDNNEETSNTPVLLTEDVVSRMKSDLHYLIPNHCRSYSIGEFKSELYLHSFSRIEYEVMDILKIERFISLVYSNWNYLAMLLQRLSFDETNEHVILSSRRTAGNINVDKTIKARLNNQNHRILVCNVNNKDVFIPENILFGATILGINLLASIFLHKSQAGQIEGFQPQHMLDLKNIVSFSDYLLKDRLLKKIVHHYLITYGGIEQVISAVTDRIMLGRLLLSRYRQLLGFVKEWTVFEWLLSDPNTLHEVLTRTLNSLKEDKLYELWIFYKILDLVGPVKQSSRNRSLFVASTGGISVEYHWQQNIGWTIQKQGIDKVDVVKRYPDVVIQKDGKNIVIIDAKCMRYSEARDDDKPEPGPQRDIVNQMLIYLDYGLGAKSDLGLVLYADSNLRDDVRLSEKESRHIVFLNCYPYSDASEKVFQGIKKYVHHCNDAVFS